VYKEGRKEVIVLTAKKRKDLIAGEWFLVFHFLHGKEVVAILAWVKSLDNSGVFVEGLRVLHPALGGLFSQGLLPMIDQSFLGEEYRFWRINGYHLPSWQIRLDFNNQEEGDDLFIGPEAICEALRETEGYEAFAPIVEFWFKQGIPKYREYLFCPKENRPEEFWATSDEEAIVITQKKIAKAGDMIRGWYVERRTPHEVILTWKE